MTDRAINRWRKRGGAVVLLTAISAVNVVGTAPAGAALPPQSTADFCANVPAANAFTDVTDNVANISCLAFTEITTGLTASSYGPEGRVTRAQMATFIARMIVTANDLEIATLTPLPTSVPDAFTDDDGLTPHEESIDRLAAAGVVSGIGGGRFAPNAPVSRAQMATFINNAQLFLRGERLTSAEDFFSDDEGQTDHEANINGLAGNGIVQGGPGGIPQTLYGPELPVSRSQMASFVIRYLALLEAGDIIKPAGAPFVVTPADEVTSVVSSSPDDSAARRTYSANVTGARVDIALFPAEFVTTNADGVVSFRDVDGTPDQADWTATGAIIELINGLGNGDADGYLDNLEVPPNGIITFAIDSTVAGSVIPVVFTNAASDGTPIIIVTPVNDAPTHSFGIGGRTNFVPA